MKNWEITELWDKWHQLYYKLFTLVDKTVDNVYNAMNIVHILQISTGICAISVDNLLSKGIVQFYAETDTFNG